MKGEEEEILNILDKEKLSLKKMAKLLAMPASTVHSKIKKMEKEGVIKGYKAVIDWKKAGYGVEAYILIYVDTTQLKKLGKGQREIKEEIAKFYFVEECNIITGDADLIVKVRAKDNQQLGYLLTEYIHGIEGIVKTKTLVCID